MLTSEERLARFWGEDYATPSWERGYTVSLNMEPRPAQKRNERAKMDPKNVGGWQSRTAEMETIGLLQKQALAGDAWESIRQQSSAPSERPI